MRLKINTNRKNSTFFEFFDYQDYDGRVRNFSSSKKLMSKSVRFSIETLMKEIKPLVDE